MSTTNADARRFRENPVDCAGFRQECGDPDNRIRREARDRSVVAYRFSNESRSRSCRRRFQNRT